MNRNSILNNVVTNESFMLETEDDEILTTDVNGSSRIAQSFTNSNIFVTNSSSNQQTVPPPSSMQTLDSDNNIQNLNHEPRHIHRHQDFVLKLEFKYIFTLFFENTFLLCLSVVSDFKNIFKTLFSLYYLIILYLFYKYMRGSKGYNCLLTCISIFLILINIFFAQIYLKFVLRN
ncbi:hypothetical protein CWI37_0386p0030 [Hamiltosporidium tvaerminnensis]|uniref:Uncharacterized protein n=1 Tax=Hamiltosporidium tvaerminnensis TaxID=1176355 RepID=A0A4Q9L6M5_9MICR|nr:hypothetical protein CWI37_0386p0030 [Hamiltosporidium tvaerminnensis]